MSQNFNFGVIFELNVYILAIKLLLIFQNWAKKSPKYDCTIKLSGFWLILSPEMENSVKFGLKN